MNGASAVVPRVFLPVLSRRKTAWIVVALSVPARLDGSSLELDLATSGRFEERRLTGSPDHRWEADWSEGAWRTRLEGARGGVRGFTITGPAAGRVRRWVIGGHALRAGQGIGVLGSVSTGNPGLRLVPDPQGALLGGGGRLDHGPWQLTMTTGLVERDRSGDAGTVRAPVILAGITRLAARRRPARHPSLAWAVVGGAGAHTGPTLAVFLVARQPQATLRADWARIAGRAAAIRLGARGQGKLGVLRLVFAHQPPGGAARATTREPWPPPRRRLEVTLRAPSGLLEVGGTAGVPEPASESARLRQVTGIAGLRLITSVGFTGAGWLAAHRLERHGARIGIARARGGVAAWLLGLRWRHAHLVLEVETRGWRGGSARAATALGSPPALAGRRLGAAGPRGGLIHLGLGWQGRGLRVRLAVGSREAHGLAPAGLLSGTVRWTTG